MKIKLNRDEESGWHEDEFEDGIEVEIPDAIVADWRETRQRLSQLEAYFDERARPQIDAEYRRRAKEWRAAHPEQAKRDDAMRDMWAKVRWFSRWAKRGEGAA